MALRDQGGLAQADTGYLVLLITLVQSALASLMLILLPLLILRGRSRSPDGATLPQWRVTGYYFWPLGSASSSSRSASSSASRFSWDIRSLQLRWCWQPFSCPQVSGAVFPHGSGHTGPAVAAAVAAIAALAAALSPRAAILLLKPALVAWPFAAKVAITLLLIAPLGIAMGMPFPLGLGTVAAEAPRLVPWA